MMSTVDGELVEWFAAEHEVPLDIAELFAQKLGFGSWDEQDSELAANRRKWDGF
jgi:hypothetical protein